MAEGGEILEGFLCPICKADLGTALQLHQHFQDEHTEDQDVLKSLKGLLGKAKKKILQLDEELFSTENDHPQPSSNKVPANYYLPVDTEPQELGATQNHMTYFRAVRNHRLERYAAETNKLLIRLDKLLNDLPQDPLKRKAHEQAIVPWIDDKDVKLCPNCAKTFHLARRKHHCRLCGAIMCNDCTCFLQLSTARKMTNPAFGQHESPSEAPPLPVASPRNPLTRASPAGGLSLLKRSGSSSSLNSVLSLVDSATGEQHFRLCVHCTQLLEARERLKEERNLKPIVSQFYERLKSYQTEANQLAAMYYKMCQSLNAGESTYNLMDAQVLRVKLLKLAENIDSLSKKILVLGTKDVDPPKGNHLLLQTKIRHAATGYLRDQLVTLPNLPTEAQITALREDRRREATARVQREKRAALEAQQRAAARHSSDRRDSPRRQGQATRQLAKTNNSNADKVDAGLGWGPEAAQMFESDDPMIQQMNIIRNYIKQARAAHKYDEVSTLETNLRELQAEYYKQQQETTD